MANSYCLSGQPYTAVPLYESSNVLDERRGDKKGIAIGLGNMAALAQVSTGALRSAEINLRRSIMLSREISDEASEALGSLELGYTLIYLGRWDESEQELAKALALFEKQEQVRGQGVTWAYRTKQEILYRRTVLTPDSKQSAILLQHLYAPITSARYALEFANDSARLGIRVLRDDVRAYWLLGAAFLTIGDRDEAELYLTKSLIECRGINLIELEADILIDLARLRAAAGDREEAQRLAQEALEITERCGYVLQGADAHLELAKLALSGDRSGLPDPTGLAREHAREARKLATCDGASQGDEPDYTYKVAYDEAGALLEQLGVNG